MSSEAVKSKQSEGKKCVNCKQFWGSQAFDGLCSTCFNKTQKGKQAKQAKQKQAKQKAQPKIQQINKTEKYKGQNKGVQQDKGRCFQCKKKVGLLGTQCKCSYIYCNLHRMPEQHACNYNFEAEGKDHLKKQIKKVEHQKQGKMED